MTETDLQTLVLDALQDAMDDTPQPAYRADGGLTMSVLGGCRRQGAYYLAKTPQQEQPSQSRAAQVGTALHAQWLPVMAELLGGESEVEVSLGHVPGTADLVLHDAVIDLKTVNPRDFDFITQPRRKWIAQVTAGALATDSSLCAVIVVCRDTGRMKWFQWHVDDHTQELLGWLSNSNHPPEEVPRDYRGPNIDKECDWCPFAYTCWPDVPGAAPQSILVHDDPGTEYMLDAYMNAAAREAEAAADKKFARDCLTGSADGEYGKYRLRWRRSAGRETLDAEAMKQLLIKLGYPIPVKHGDPKTAIDVRPVT